MNIKKRLLVLLITVSMLLSGSFVQAFAEEETVESASVAVPESVSEEDPEDTAEAEEVKEKEEVVEKEETAPAEEETPASVEETQKSSDPVEPDMPDEKSKETADNKVEEAFTSGKLTFECDEYTVTLEYGKKAGIPEGTVLDVREISSDTDDAKEQKEYETYYDRSLEQLRSEKGGDTIAKLGFARFYDITLVSGGKEIEPGDDVKVTFKYSKDSRESVKEGNKEGDAIRVIHMMESGKNGEIKAKPIEKKDTDLTLDKKELTEAAFTTDSFSVYGIVYTVDFEYEGYTYSIPGESEIMLSDLFESLHIEESIKDVKNVEFTDYSLIKIERTGEDWKLISLKPFSTEEKLTVTLEDKIIEIKITDDTPVAKVSNDGGNTWTEHAYLVNNNTQDDGVTKIGAFDQANTLSGTVTIELLYDTHERYTLSSGFTFTGINSLTIKGKGADNKSTLVKNQTSAPMITTKGIETVELDNIVFDGNDKVTTSGNGGAVNTDAKELTVSNCEFNNCQAGLQGGGIYHNNIEGMVIIAGSKFVGCRANGPSDDKGGGGGGVFTTAQSVAVTGSSFYNCTTKVRQGAGLFHKRTKTNPAGSETIVKDSTFEKCISAWSGGGMETDAWYVTLERTTFTDCEATKGGAINVWADGQDATTNHTTLVVKNCSFDSCIGTDFGGAIRSTSFTSLTDSSFVGCESNTNGGAVACTNSNTGTIVTGCTISKCHADNGNGGAIYTVGTIQISESPNGEAVIDNCSAKNGGAVACMNNNAETVVTGGTISNCHADKDNGYGGAIYATGKIQISESPNVGTLIKGCSAKNGGAVACMNNNAETVVTGGTISNCHADKDNGNGGAIYATGKIQISESPNVGTLIEGCSAKNGGAVACTNNNAETVVTGGTIRDCSADGNGGAIQSNNLTMSGGSIEDCFAAGNGGAIQSNNPTMSGGSIVGCSATKGGAINSTAKITMTGGTITRCITRGDSAALDAATGTSGLTFSGNVRVEGNKGSDDEARDVYLGTKTDRHILIDGYGLGENASIGVYVADAAYENYGRQGKRFAHTGTVRVSSMQNIDKLFSDRPDGDNSVMRGVAATRESGDDNYEYRIMWGVVQTPVAPTNVDLQLLPYILILIGGAVLVLMKKVSDRRRKTENEGDQDS